MSNRQEPAIPTDALNRWDEMSRGYQGTIDNQRKYIDNLIKVNSALQSALNYIAFEGDEYGSCSCSEYARKSLNEARRLHAARAETEEQ